MHHKVEFVSIVNIPEFGFFFILVFEVSCIAFILGPSQFIIILVVPFSFVMYLQFACSL